MEEIIHYQYTDYTLTGSSVLGVDWYTYKAGQTYTVYITGLLSQNAIDRGDKFFLQFDTTVLPGRNRVYINSSVRTTTKYTITMPQDVTCTMTWWHTDSTEGENTPIVGYAKAYSIIVMVGEDTLDLKKAYARNGFGVNLISNGLPMNTWANWSNNGGTSIDTATFGYPTFCISGTGGVYQSQAAPPGSNGKIFTITFDVYFEGRERGMYGFLEGNTILTQVYADGRPPVNRWGTIIQTCRCDASKATGVIYCYDGGTERIWVRNIVCIEGNYPDLALAWVHSNKWDTEITRGYPNRDLPESFEQIQSAVRGMHIYLKDRNIFKYGHFIINIDDPNRLRLLNGGDIPFSEETQAFALRRAFQFNPAVHGWLGGPNNVITDLEPNGVYTWAILICTRDPSGAPFVGSSEYSPAHFWAYSATETPTYTTKYEIIEYKQTPVTNNWTWLYVTFRLKEDATRVTPFVWCDSAPNINIWIIAYAFVKGDMNNIRELVNWHGCEYFVYSDTRNVYSDWVYNIDGNSGVRTRTITPQAKTWTTTRNYTDWLRNGNITNQSETGTRSESAWSYNVAQNKRTKVVTYTFNDGIRKDITVEEVATSVTARAISTSNPSIQYPNAIDWCAANGGNITIQASANFPTGSIDITSTATYTIISGTGGTMSGNIFTWGNRGVSAGGDRYCTVSVTYGSLTTNVVTGQDVNSVTNTTYSGQTIMINILNQAAAISGTVQFNVFKPTWNVTRTYSSGSVNTVEERVSSGNITLQKHTSTPPELRGVELSTYTINTATMSNPIPVIARFPNAISTDPRSITIVVYPPDGSLHTIQLTQLGAQYVDYEYYLEGVNLSPGGVISGQAQSWVVNLSRAYKATVADGVITNEEPIYTGYVTINESGGGSPASWFRPNFRQVSIPGEYTFTIDRYTNSSNISRSATISWEIMTTEGQRIVTETFNVIQRPAI